MTSTDILDTPKRRRVEHFHSSPGIFEKVTCRLKKSSLCHFFWCNRTQVNMQTVLCRINSIRIMTMSGFKSDLIWCCFEEEGVRSDVRSLVQEKKMEGKKNPKKGSIKCTPAGIFYGRKRGKKWEIIDIEWMRAWVIIHRAPLIPPHLWNQEPS